MTARHIHIQGVVQGVGFRPYVFRLARARQIGGWVRNGHDGVRIHAEGTPASLDAFLRDLVADPPAASQIVGIEVWPDDVNACDGFEIRGSDAAEPPTTRISPDLPVCGACLREMQDPADRRFQYPYINCTNCGPRYSIIRALPYDRARTTMVEWALCAQCAAEYDDPRDRRFHAQPVACPRCGPGYPLWPETAALLRRGAIVAIKGVGGYHLACDAENAAAVATLRDRKYRKDKPFAIMVRDVAVAERTVTLTVTARGLLESLARPIVLAPARVVLPGVAPDSREIGVMLPYAPLHHLLFAAGAPDRLVMTSGNRSSEPIAYEDADAQRRLAGMADAFLIGERPIARRVDDSVVRDTRRGPMVLRRSRGLAPAAVTLLPATQPILALGGDLKSAITLVVEGQAYVSQHIGDLSHHEAFRAFEETVRDLLDMYRVDVRDLLLVRDTHPEYASTRFAASVAAARTIAVQHHRAHIASVLAERGAFDRQVVGVALDGTGYGDDGTIWGGELFVGSLDDGFVRARHLHPAALPGGDAAAQFPVQAAAGFLAELPMPLPMKSPPDFTAAPFCFPARFTQACALVQRGVRTFATTSAGRLFDTVAALAGFTRPITYEGQAAMWLEQLAHDALDDDGLFPWRTPTLDWRDTLAAIVDARLAGLPPAIIARRFHRTLARAIASAVCTLAERAAVRTVVLSGGVMQNALLLDDLDDAFADLAGSRLEIWLNQQVPPNDGGLSLGQAALAIRTAASTSPAAHREPPASPA